MIHNVLLYQHCAPMSFLFFFFNAPATTEIYTLSLHDALPILKSILVRWPPRESTTMGVTHVTVSVSNLAKDRSEEHTSELQSRFDLVCRLLLEKKKNISKSKTYLNTKQP